MADSDSSRTLPSVTRRTLLQMATTTLAARVAAAQPARGGEDALACEGDPALVLWRDWQAANRKARAIERRQARLESRLVDAVGFPQIELTVPGRAKPMIVSTTTEIEHWLIPALIDQNPWVHWRRPMDMMFHGRCWSFRQA